MNLNIFFICCILYNFQFNDIKDYIIWSDQKLKIIDFKGVSNKGFNKVAETAYHITRSITFTDDSICFYIVNNFNRNRSWIEKKTTKILKHEQLHFDISELYARKIRKSFYLIPISKNSFENQLDSLFNKFMVELNYEQDKYDLETQHSIIDSAQIRWEKEINIKIKFLESYKDSICCTIFNHN